MIYVHYRSLFRLIMRRIPVKTGYSVYLKLFSHCLQKSEAETACDHITLNSKHPDGSSLKLL